jgi:hypothetical protein
MVFVDQFRGALANHDARRVDVPLGISGMMLASAMRRPVDVDCRARTTERQ